MYALIGTVGGTVLALSVHHGQRFFESRNQVSEYHQEMMLAMEQPIDLGDNPALLAADGVLPLDAAPEPGYPAEPGSMRPSVQFTHPVPPPPRS